MTKPDFEKIFASGGTTLPLTDSQFLQGFAYLGENPPTKEEFNWLFQQLCLKMQWLNQNAGFGRWQAEHAYTAGEICFSSVIGDYRFAECTVGGQSGTLEPTWSTVGSTVTDGGVTWVVRDLRQGTSIGKIPALIDVGGGKAGLPAVSGKLLTDISGEQIGTIKPWLVTVVPAGWLALDTGALVSRTTYAELWTWVQANAPLISEADWQTQAAAQTSVGAYSTGDGSTTFRLPRILDYVRGGLTAEVGAWQGDAFKSHYHNLGANVVTETGTGGIGGISDSGNMFLTKTLEIGGAETRPKTIKMLYCVKAFDATTNQGLIDITALANEMTAKQQLLKYAVINETQASGTSGGTFTSGAWRTRTLNTIQYDNIGITLSGNQITLPAGVYMIKASCPAYCIENHKSRLQNITDATTMLLGSSSRSSSANSTQTESEMTGIVVVSGSKVLELQHYCTTTFATNGLGYPTALSGISEIYSRIEIVKVA